MLAYRRLPLDGLMNARDLGGYAACGGVTRSGVFLRSDVPALLSEADLRFLRLYELSAAVDLRSEAERERTPDMLAAQSWVRYTAVPLYDKTAARGEGLDGKTFCWADHYIRLVDHAQDWVRDVFAALADAPGCVLFHCATGKDRTGIIAALLLSLCGVSDEDAAADYCLSRLYLAPLVEELCRSGRIASRDDPFFATQPENMLRLLAYLRERYGGVPDYLSACGLSQARQDALRRRLTQTDETRA